MNIEEANTNYDIEELKKLYPDAWKIAPFKPFKPYLIEIDKLHTIDLRPFFNKAVQYSIENNLIGNYQPKNRP